MKADETRITRVPEPLAKELAKRYRPVVDQCSKLLSSSMNLEQMLLSVYLQGVLDGAQVLESTPGLAAELAKRSRP